MFLILVEKQRNLNWKNNNIKYLFIHKEITKDNENEKRI